MPLYAFNKTTPLLGPGAFVFTSAILIGDVVLDEGASVWPGAVLRGDVERIHLGAHTSFQDNSVAHTDPGYPVTVGPDCVIGHNVVLHGATVGARCLIGMGAILLNGCVVGDESIVGAGALLTQGKVFPPRSLIIGSPAKAVREVTDDDLKPRAELRDRYARRSKAYLEAGLGVEPLPRYTGRAPVRGMRALVREITETFFAPDAAAWRAWLAAHHADRHEIWLVMLKRHVDEPSITLPEAVDEAVCYGWIDGQVRRIDDRSHALRFTPRKPASQWSQSNKDRVARLSAAGRMAAPGLAAVAAAKANGLWDALTSPEADATPPEPPGGRA